MVLVILISEILKLLIISGISNFCVGNNSRVSQNISKFENYLAVVIAVFAISDYVCLKIYRLILHIDFNIFNNNITYYQFLFWQ